ncbi:MAG: EAL domain-containing protein [Campylobacterales bacterium]|nr:EAL domain-containing protein [Campylobacterales bacterium]
MNRVKLLFTSLKWQLFIGVIVLHAVLMGIFVYDLIQRERQFIDKQALAKVQELSGLIASNASLGIINNDIVALDELVNQVKNIEDIDLIFLMDKNCRILSSNDSEYFNQIFTDRWSLAIQKELHRSGSAMVQKRHDGIIDTNVPIRLGTKIVGYVRMLSTTNRVDHQIELLRNKGLFYLFLAIVSGAFVAWMIVRHLTSRLTLLSQAASEVAKHNYEIILPPFHGEDEIAQMGRAFGSMIESIHDQVNALSFEITQRKETEELLDYKAHHDELTNLSSRALFLDRLEHAIKKAKWQERMLAVLFIDLDRFKEINDSLGHEMGDRVLIEIAERLRENLREIDTIARLGGDEFTLIVEDIDGNDKVNEIASRVLKILQQPIQIDQHQLYVTSSIGISFYPHDGEDAQNLLRNADSAMYKAKIEGRNSYQYYTEELTARAYERVLLESNLRRAIENQEFVVYYQPQMDGESEKMIGMEALVRWQHPEMGLISPATFIPIAEETGLIVAIDQLVMKSALNQIVQWRNEGLNPGILSLNLAMKQLWQESFIETLQLMLEESGCKPEWIELEVTEGEVMKNPEMAIGILQRLHDMGIALAIDDFGTGYSSLSYLKRLPLDLLKIDQSFVRGIPDNNEDIAIVRAIIALAKSMGMRVIAEGVESVEQKEFLVENGCRAIQGYFYSRPMPSSEMGDWMRTALKDIKG